MAPWALTMEPGALAATLAIMGVAGYLHTVSGFGLGMIVMGAAGGLGVASVPVLAAVVSLVTLVNSAVALQPRPHHTESPSWTFAVSGVLTGLCGGLFGVPGPPVIYHCYRQPLPLETIRLLLILCFAITSGVRTLYVASQGGLTGDVWQLALWSMPVVGGATWLGRRYPPPCSAGLMRGLAMLTLIGLGAAILVKGAILLASG